MRDAPESRDPARPVPPPQRFILYRRQDVTGVSGTGCVATGIVWPDGHAALRWRADDREAASSTSVWSSVADLLRVHGHDGRTEICYVDPAGPTELHAAAACCPRCHEPVA